MVSFLTTLVKFGKFLSVKLRISHKVICQVVDAIKSNKTRNKSRQSGDQADKENC